MNRIQFMERALKDISQEIVSLVLKKDFDYDSAFDKAVSEFGTVYPVSKLYEKYQRIRRLALSGHKVKNRQESLEDSIRDLIGYGLLWLRYRKLEDLSLTNPELFKDDGI